MVLFVVVGLERRKHTERVGSSSSSSGAGRWMAKGAEDSLTADAVDDDDDVKTKLCDCTVSWLLDGAPSKQRVLVRLDRR